MAVVDKESNDRKVIPKQGNEQGYLRSRMSVIILNIFEINYSQLIQYEILEKLVTLIPEALYLFTTMGP